MTPIDTIIKRIITNIIITFYFKDTIVFIFRYLIYVIARLDLIIVIFSRVEGYIVFIIVFILVCWTRLLSNDCWLCRTLQSTGEEIFAYVSRLYLEPFAYSSRMDCDGMPPPQQCAMQGVDHFVF